VVDDNESEAGTPRRPRRSKPFWRKGWFWVGVIVAEVVVVLVLSVVFERSSTEVDLAGADTTAFCDRARAVREQSLQASEAGSQNGSVGDPTAFEQERAAYLELATIAPPALVADLERLAALDDEIIETVRAIGEKKATDPSYSGLADLSAALERASVKGQVAATRLNLVLQDECGIDAAAGVTTTTAAPAPTEPDMRPTIPGTTPS
jgi:hypothetical protein